MVIIYTKRARADGTTRRGTDCLYNPHEDIEIRAERILRPENDVEYDAR